MEINRQDWHMRVYLWWYNHKYNGGHSWDSDKTQTNLCPYMRAVLIWAPMRALFWDWIRFNLVPDGSKYISLNMIVIPLLMFGLPQPLGYISYALKMILWIATAMATAMVVLTGLGVWMVQGLKLWMMRRERERVPKPRKPQKPKRPSTFWPAVAAYLRSGHDRICPEVHIVDDPIEPTPPPCKEGDSTTTHEV